MITKKVLLIIKVKICSVMGFLLQNIYIKITKNGNKIKCSSNLMQIVLISMTNISCLYKSHSS